MENDPETRYQLAKQFATFGGLVGAALPFIPDFRQSNIDPISGAIGGAYVGVVFGYTYGAIADIIEIGCNKLEKKLVNSG